MTHKSLIEKKSQAGFTLVELAIVMIIIGLLIGGVLKGQELIGNAEIAATSSQIEGFDAATTTFRDIYDAVPGDIINPDVRIPNCASAPCSDAGDGNGRVDSEVPGDASSGENDGFWIHLHFADLLSGIDPNGQIYPDAEVDGSYTMGYHAGGALGHNTDGAFRGHYATIVSTPGAAAGDDSLTASQAARLDRKLDDGVSDTGSVFANSGDCDTGTAGEYDEADQAATCDLHFRIQ